MSDSNYERNLEAVVDQELKTLSDVPAPAHLASRVMKIITVRSRQTSNLWVWDTWSLPLRHFALVTMIAAFGLACLGSWKIRQILIPAFGWEARSEALSTAVTLWNALVSVVGALMAGIQQAGPIFTGACVTAVALAYAMCIAIGGLYLRLGMARR